MQSICILTIVIQSFDLYSSIWQSCNFEILSYTLLILLRFVYLHATVYITCTYVNTACLCCNSFFFLASPQCHLPREAWAFVVLLFLERMKKQDVWLSGERKRKNNRIPSPHPPRSLSPPPPAWFVLNEGISACIPCVPDNAPSSVGPERVLSLCLCPLINCFIQGSAC